MKTGTEMEQLTEQEIVQHMTQLLCNDSKINEYINRVQQVAGSFWADGEPATDAEETAFYSERANIMYRLIGLMAAHLYHHGVE